MMNKQALAQSAYNASAQTVRSSRAIEYDAISRITHDLKDAMKNKNQNYPAFVQALHKNNQLWAFLAGAVVEGNNILSAEARAQIFYLAEFSRRHAAQVLSGKSDAKPLLEINTAVLRGLRQGVGM